MKPIIRIFLFLFLYVLCSCTTNRMATSLPKTRPGMSMRLLGQYIIPYNLQFNNTTVGGLSGIDYDSARDCYYLVSDDRSATGPARFYTAKIKTSEKGIDSAWFISVDQLRRQNGDTFPNSKTDPLHTPDPEAMRYFAPKDQLVWSSEGERIVKATDTVLVDPSINLISTTGKYLAALPIPANLHMMSIEKGPRQNGVLEGLSFADNFKTLFVSVEEPLYEDGPRAGLEDNNAFTRIIQYDMETQREHSQFAYKLEPIAHAANPSTAFKINGVPDILAIGKGQLLVIERSFSTGSMQCTIRVFLADLTAASNIKNISSLQGRNDFTPIRKKSILNMDDLGIFIDNIEGVSFGPVLPNGNKTLLFVADNNFNLLEKNQLLLFELLEE